jgi:DNA-binding NtrC family response regulator
MDSMTGAASDSTFRLGSELGAYELLVTGEGGVRRVPVPKEGALVVGRAPDADVRLEANSVSRRHALFRASAAEFTLEDLGSSNGTHVRGARVPAQTPLRITPGESFVIGEFVLVLRALRSRATPRHVWTEEYFEARLHEQCARSRDGDGLPFHVIGVRLASKARGEPAQVLATELEASDVLGRLSEDQWAVLLLEASDSEADALAARLEHALSGAGCLARTSVLGYPRDGTSAGALLARLADAADANLAGGVPANVVLRSSAMVALYAQTESVARGDINVLILGETGVGKDVLAKSIHDRSERRGKPFLRLNCAALAEPLLESELFGHEKGSFTGASHSHPGLLQSAAGGSVFLDEIGEFPYKLQAKLLQVLENREILSVGSVKPRSIDVRFIAATNRDLEADALAGEFRSDLYYRLAGFSVLIPPLRERREDILPIAMEFLRGVSERMGLRSAVRIRDDAAVRLLDYAWPGNVRELRNVIERALVLSEGASIGAEHLPLDKMRSVVLVGRPKPTADAGEATSSSPAGLSAEELAERQRILDALATCAGNQSKAAELLGVSRSTLVNRLNAYRIRRPRKHRR